MQKVDNKTLQLFLDRFIEELKEENDRRKPEKEINIPFVISSLYQSFEEHTDMFKEFIQDLCLYTDYTIDILNSQYEYNGLIDAEIKLFRNLNKYNKNGITPPNHNYKFCFTYDERYFGFCDCTPDMPDYREDKQCCGHGCDAIFCDFSIYKVSRIVSGSWKGDEHDYWKFEDEFYMSEKDLAEKKEKEERKIMIKELRNRIEEDQKRLAELESM